MRTIFNFFIFYILLISKSFALIEIDITRGNLDPLPIAISPLHVDIKSEKYDGLKIKLLGDNISKIIEDNFRSTGLFNPLKKEAFVQKPDIAHLKPRFEDWRLIFWAIFCDIYYSSIKVTFFTCQSLIDFV